MRLQGKIKSIDLDFITHKPKLTLEINSQYDLLTEELNDLQQLEVISIELKKTSKKRSLDANAYCWVLIGKIAHVIKSTKEEVYKQFINTYGIYRVITLDNKAVDTFIKVWCERGLGWMCEASASRYEGFSDVVAYYGTSSYNSRQMAVFVDYVVDEARNLGIEVLPAHELESLKQAWA